LRREQGANESHLDGFADQSTIRPVIKRSNPEVGYLMPDVYETFSFSQMIKAGSTLYVSGVAPFTSRSGTLELVGEGDPRAQLERVLEILQRCLAAEGATFHNWVAQAVYTTSIAELEPVADSFRRFMGEHTPTSTWVEVKGLFHPKQVVEINGIAVLA
jgi:enamine deaminase RidA (YjgF/YER057c/UK114 family)